MEWQSAGYIALLIALPFTAAAEHVCRADVHYQWKAPDAETTTKVFIERFEQKGTDEKTAKEALAKIVQPQLPRARELCLRHHQNEAACVAAKFGGFSSTSQGLTFSARKKLEESIVADCKSLQGTCLEGVATDPACEEIVVAAAGDEKAAEGKDKKDAKGKKK